MVLQTLCKTITRVKNPYMLLLFLMREKPSATLLRKRYSKTATYLTVQTGEDKHITLQPEFLQYINHSCYPNVFFDTTAMQLVALKEIQPGDELMFFYPSTEWDMSQPFDCFCGTTQCLHRIQGAAYLSDEEAKGYRLTDFINEKFQTRKEK